MIKLAILGSGSFAIGAGYNEKSGFLIGIGVFMVAISLISFMIEVHNG